jgi:hypothetical protein
MKMYDVLNNIILKATMMPMTGSERLCSYDWVESIPKNSISLIDRGFPSYTLFWLFLNSGSKDFVARCSVGFNNKIKAFVSSNETSLLITIYPDSKAIAVLKNLGKIVSENDGVTIRAEKIKLDTGEIEILLTSILDESKMSNAELKELYFKRWSIETAISYSKNIFQLERFSSHKVNGIEQDFYATLITSNIHALILEEAQKKVNKEKGKRKYDYKVNLSASTNEFKKKIHKILRGDNLEVIIIELVKVFALYTEPIRPDRKYERKKRSRRRNGKIQTDKNHRYNM